jgi:hypothetical protein
LRASGVSSLILNQKAFGDAGAASGISFTQELESSVRSLQNIAHFQITSLRRSDNTILNELEDQNEINEVCFSAEALQAQRRTNPNLNRSHSCENVGSFLSAAMGYMQPPGEVEMYPNQPSNHPRTGSKHHRGLHMHTSPSVVR